jgi:hypothetical protein
MHEGWRPQATAIVHGLTQDVLCGDAPSNLMDVCSVELYMYPGGSRGGSRPCSRRGAMASFLFACEYVGGAVRLGGVQREMDGSSLSSSEPWEYET